MNASRTTPDDAAASEVVAIVLLVAVVVVLVAVIGPIVLGVGGGVTEGGTAPQAQFSWSYDDATSTLTMTHEGGNTVEKARLRFVGSGSGEMAPTWSDPDDEVTAEDEAELSGVSSDEIVRVFWTDPDADKQQLIVRWVGPDAEPPDG